MPIPWTLQAVSRDPDGNAVLECAIAGADLLTLDTFKGVKIVRIAEFLRRWEAGEVLA